MFKRYLLDPSLESQKSMLLSRQSSLRFSEYRSYLAGREDVQQSEVCREVEFSPVTKRSSDSGL